VATTVTLKQIQSTNCNFLRSAQKGFSVVRMKRSTSAKLPRALLVLEAIDAALKAQRSLD
jgi:hypothetical protein